MFEDEAMNDMMSETESATILPMAPKRRCGFAAMDASRQKELASLGGKASHAKGTGHEWNQNAARDAGRKGGIASGESRKRRKIERKSNSA